MDDFTIVIEGQIGSLISFGDIRLIFYFWFNLYFEITIKRYFSLNKIIQSVDDIEILKYDAATCIQEPMPITTTTPLVTSIPPVAGKKETLFY